MKKDKEKTVVTFYKEEDGQILAVFPEDGYDNFTETVSCYSHIGQHSAVHPDYTLFKCEPCTEPSQYADLQKELEGLGYNLTITNVVNVIKPTKNTAKYQHTQGKWTSTGLEIRHKNRGLILATVYSHLESNQPRQEAEANAKLIASAPDLLEAMQEFCERVEKGEVRSTYTYTKFKALIKLATS